MEVGSLSSSPIEVTVDGETFQVEVESPSPPPGMPGRTRPRTGGRPFAPPRTPAAASNLPDGVVVSPMPGRVISILVRPGDAVAAGDELCVVEAMKMEQSIRAARDGVVKSVHVQPMDSVGANDPLMELE